jgi:hypothetical protein
VTPTSLLNSGVRVGLSWAVRVTFSLMAEIPLGLDLGVGFWQGCKIYSILPS